jgi:anti-sigma regulatory factor (Ser/Thr protein kinase)
MHRQFGLPPQEIVAAVERATAQREILFSAVLDEPALWDPSTIDDIVRDFPAGLLSEGDLFLVLSECFANAALHGRAQAVGLYARRRGNLMMLSVVQNPPMLGRVAIALSIARTSLANKKSCDLENGLGFPILLRLAQNVVITLDYTRLLLFFPLVG